MSLKVIDVLKSINVFEDYRCLKIIDVLKSINVFEDYRYCGDYRCFLRLYMF